MVENRPDPVVGPAASDPALLLADSRVVAPGALARLALRRELAGCAALLARQAGAESPQWSIELARAVARGDGPTSSGDLHGLRAPGLYGLALLAAVGPEPDPVRAADLLELARRVADETGAESELVDLAAQAMVLTDRPDAARRHAAHPKVDPWVRWAVEADLTHPALGGDPDAWLETFNGPLRERGLAPLAPAPGLGTTFDRLDVVETPPPVEDGPLVTVIMSVHAPTSSLLPAVRSVLDQTWRHLQMIVVDDANGPQDAETIRRLRDLDPRVEVVRQEVNGGTYRARNRALELARGELIGFNDSDDWVHPQRIERQVAAMTADPGLVATLSRAVRVDADLRMTRLGLSPFAINFPSLLFRRDPVLRRLGRFDAIRKAADREYVERIAAVFGPEAVRTLEEPLTMYQLTTGSLSRTDFRPSWHHPARRAYHEAFRCWHDRIRAGASPDLGSYPARPFPVPAVLGGPEEPAEGPDVVVLADLRPGIPAASALPAELEALAATGARVGLAGAEAVRHASRTRSRPRGSVVDLVVSGRAVWTPLMSDRRVPVLVLRDPDLLTVPPRSSSVLLRADRVVVAASSSPGQGGSARYAPALVDARARELFGAHDVLWWPSGPGVAAELVGHGVRVGSPVPWDLPGPVAAPRPVPGRPVVGLLDHSRYPSERADRSGWGALAGRLDADVRVLTREPSRSLPPGWVALDGRSLPVEAFLAMCDVVLLHLPLRWSEVAARTALDALALGCLPAVRPSLAEATGLPREVVAEGPDDVARVVAALEAPEERRRVHAEAVRCVRLHTAEGWASRVTALL